MLNGVMVNGVMLNDVMVNGVMVNGVMWLLLYTRVISLWVWNSILCIVNINCMHCWLLLLPCVWRGFI
jgi:hypothetical protein